MSATLHVRPPHYADGRWYSANAAQLKKDIQNYMSSPPPAPPVADIVGLVAPHAGHFFSGHVAGAGFAALTPGAFETVVLLGPDHRGAAPGKISTVKADSWRTPLGDIPVAWPVLDALQSEIELVVLPADNEHSLEIELPFLQVALEQFKLAPLMMGVDSPQACRRLGSALLEALTIGRAGPTLFVASSDLSHYFDDATARRLDENTLQFIINLDADGLLNHIKTGRRQGQPLACGGAPIATVIHAGAGLGVTHSHLLKYATSADAYPDKSQVVGYAAVAFSK